MSKIKLCGLTRPQDIEAVNEALPDYIGFVFAESRRKVSHEQAQRLKAQLDKKILAVGVFVNAELNEIISLCQGGIIELVQLHGDENADYINKLRQELSNQIIKSVRVRSEEDILSAQKLLCDYLLLDTYVKDAYGGSGKSFDWSLIPSLEKPFFLAGGLTIDNIRLAATYHPFCLDVSSGAETDGFKDVKKILEIVNSIREVS